MERRLATHHMKTPTTESVVLPTRPTPTHQVEPAEEQPTGGERLVAYGHTAVPADRALERLSTERIAEIRLRLETGAYGSPDVMQELAMRLLESGDLDG